MVEDMILWLFGSKITLEMAFLCTQEPQSQRARPELGWKCAHNRMALVGRTSALRAKGRHTEAKSGIDWRTETVINLHLVPIWTQPISQTSVASVMSHTFTAFTPNTMFECLRLRCRICSAFSGSWINRTKHVSRRVRYPSDLLLDIL